MPSSDFHCPFCEQTSPKPQGLSDHIRNRHQKQYSKWLKTPGRLAPTQKAATPPGVPEQLIQPLNPVPSAQQKVPVPSKQEAPAIPALDLLKRAHAELISRKQSIEADLARQIDLRKELETIKEQIHSLDNTLGVFESEQLPV